MNTLLTVGRGLGDGSALALTYQIENCVRVGHHNHMHAASCQILETTTTFSVFARVFEAAGLTAAVSWANSWALYAIGWIVPGAISYGVASQIEDQSLRRVILLIHDNIGFVCQVANVVSAIALIYFGQIAYGTVLLTTITIGLLDQIGILPQRVRQVAHVVLQTTGSISGLLFGNFLTKVLFICKLVDIVFSKFFGNFVIRYEDHGLSPVDPGSLSNLTIDQVEVNPGHIHYPLPIPDTAPDVDMLDILTLCDEINWEDPANANALRLKRMDDNRTQELVPQEQPPIDGGHSQGQPLPDPVAQFKASLRNCIEAIAERRILDGEPLNYDLLVIFVKHIAHHLRRVDIPLTEKVDILLSMGIDGGGYCGVAKFGVMEQIYFYRIAVLNPALAMEGRLSLGLNLERERIFQIIMDFFLSFRPRTVTTNPETNAEEVHTSYDISWQRRLLQHLIPINDQHIYRMYLNLLGPNFGIVSLSSQNDPVSQPPGILLAFYSWLLRTEDWQNMLWGGYTAPSILNYVQQEMVGTPLLPTDEIYSWWRNWINNCPHLNERARELWHPWLEKGGLTDPSGKIYNQYIIAMLLERGIFKRRDLAASH